MASFVHCTSSSAAYQPVANEIKENSRTVVDCVRDADVHSAASVYVHVPFCVHKCHYCDFYSIVDNQNRQAAFVDRLVREMQASRRFFLVPIRTIFVGGGTPTLLEPALWRTLGKAMNECLPLAPDGEFTVEANPETVTPELAEALVSVGVSRVSIGAQSFDARHLQMLERRHDPRNVQRSIEIFRSAGVKNINVDLIFAIPGQTLSEWERDLQHVIALQPSHISCYGLTYEPGTAMTQRLKLGQFARADDALEAEMYELAIDRLAAAGFEHYEISNWAMPSRRCRHNLAYWMNQNWWALGPSASGHVNGLRWKNVPRISDYLAGVDAFPPVIDVERVDADARAGEALMLRLRLLDGVPRDVLAQLLNDERRAAVERHTAAGLLEWHNDALRLTRRGLLLADTVLSDLV